MQPFIKNLGIIICCIYCFFKLLHITPEKKSRIFLFGFCILLSAAAACMDSYNQYLTLPTLVLALSIFLSFHTRSPLSVSVTAMTIAYAISYILFTASAMIASTIFLASPKNVPHIWLQSVCFFIELLIIQIPFRFKRTKKGMPFLQKQFYAIPGMIISIFVLTVSVILNPGNNHPIYAIPTFFLGILAVLIYQYWKNNLTKTYLDKLNAKNIESLNAELLEKQSYIEALEQDNRQMAKMIHKDNKLIPAMEYAVQTYIKENSLSSTDDNRGKELLEELNRLSKDRKGLLATQDRQCEKLPSSKVASIDNLLQYMQQKAANEGITLHVTLDCNVEDLIRNIISEDTLNTLLADLLENAIIATKYNNGRYILLNISMLSTHYSLHIFDCGIPFTKEVLIAYGQKQITTHADDSGSGIGLMQTYEILKTLNASLLIDEFGSGLYTKKISVIFNKRNQYTLYTARTEDELAFLNKRADLVIVKK